MKTTVVSGGAGASLEGSLFEGDGPSLALAERELPGLALNQSVNVVFVDLPRAPIHRQSVLSSLTGGDYDQSVGVQMLGANRVEDLDGSGLDALSSQLADAATRLDSWQKLVLVIDSRLGGISAACVVANTLLKMDRPAAPAQPYCPYGSTQAGEWDLKSLRKLPENMHVLVLTSNENPAWDAKQEAALARLGIPKDCIHRNTAMLTSVVEKIQEIAGS